MRINAKVEIADSELVEEFVLGSGPGGQNVNKVCTAVKLRFAAAASPALPEPVKARLLKLAGHRADRDGVITIDARQHRHRERNREDARERLRKLILAALWMPKARRPTRPGRGARERRLDTKRRHAQGKQRRQWRGGVD